MNDYPRMLYRPGNGPSEVWGEAVDTKVVASQEEEAAELRAGWMRDPTVACAKAKRVRELKSGLRWFASHWQFWITTSLAVAALLVGYLALK